MDGLISSVGIQIQRAISEAIKEQVLPQIQASLGASSGQGTQKGKNVPSERPERSSEESYSQKVRRISSRELPRNRLGDEDRVNTHDMVTGDNESLQKMVGGAQWNRPLNQIKITTITKMKFHNTSVMMKIPKKLKKNQIFHQLMIPKKPQKTPKILHCKKNP